MNLDFVWERENLVGSHILEEVINLPWINST
jgi:hypothetical protein